MKITIPLKQCINENSIVDLKPILENGRINPTTAIATGAVGGAVAGGISGAIDGGVLGGIYDLTQGETPSLGLNGDMSTGVENGLKYGAAIGGGIGVLQGMAGGQAVNEFNRRSTQNGNTKRYTGKIHPNKFKSK